MGTSPIACAGCGKTVSLTSFGRCPLCGVAASSGGTKLLSEAAGAAATMASKKSSSKEVQLADALRQLELGRDPETTARQLRLQGHDEGAIRRVLASGTKARASLIRRRGIEQVVASGGILVLAFAFFRFLNDPSPGGVRWLPGPKLIILLCGSALSLAMGIVRLVVGR